MAGTEPTDQNAGEGGSFGRQAKEPDDSGQGGGSGLLARLAAAVGRADKGNPGPKRAELVDGAEVYFIDEAASQKSLYEYDLVLMRAEQYPGPVVLKSHATRVIEKGTVLTKARSPTIVALGEKRVIVRAVALVPPSRAEEVAQDDALVPRGLWGETVPRRPAQSPKLYNKLVEAASE